MVIKKKNFKKAILQIEDGLLLEQLRNWFSCPNEQYEMLRRRGFFVSPRDYWINKKGEFEVGLTKEVQRVALQEFKVNLQIDPELEKLVSPKLDFEFKDNLLNFKERYFQIEAGKIVFNNFRGILHMGTGAGKTATIATIFENIYRNNPNFRCIFIVPDRGLVTQACGDFKNYGVSFKFDDIKKVDDYKNFNVIVANRQQLITKDFDENIIKKANYVVMDEVHLASNDTAKFIKVIDKNITTPYILGLTGTIPPENSKRWDLYGMIAPPIYAKSGDELRKEGFISNVDVLQLSLKYKKKPVYVHDPSDPGKMYRDELSFIANSEFRNNIIFNFVKSVKKPVLVLTDTREQNAILYELLKDTGKKIYVVNGSVKENERDLAKADMEKNDDTVIIATTTIFKQGQSINNLHYMIFASPTDDEETVVQAIGRTLRLHHSKSKSIIVDINDNLKYSTEYSENRLKIYATENIKVTIKTIEE